MKAKKIKVQKLKKKDNILLTANDLKNHRRFCLEKQNYIDPIIKTKIDPLDAAMDHDHESNRTRMALNFSVNSWEGKITNSYIRMMKWVTDKPLPELLRNLADYLEMDFSDQPFHPKFVDKLLIEFSKLNAEKKKSVLKHFNLDETAKNDNQRKSIFKKYLKLGQTDFIEGMKIIKSR